MTAGARSNGSRATPIAGVGEAAAHRLAPDDRASDFLAAKTGVCSATIPNCLRERRQWLRWRYEQRGGKATKVPYVATDPLRPASSTDPATWGTFEQVQEVRAQADGIGFVFTANDPFVGIDLDDCITEQGEIAPWASEIVEALDSYTERTPSGRGLHIIVRAELRGPRRREGSFEVYDSGRYFTVTGERIGEREAVEDRREQLDVIYARMFPPEPERASRASTGAGIVDASDHELLERAFRARNGAKLEALFRGELNGHGSHSEADLALCSSVAFWTGPDPARVDRLFRASGLMRSKWDEARGKSTYGAQTVSRALERSEFYAPSARPADAATHGAWAGQGDKAEPTERLALTDLGNAERFAAAHAGRLRYLRERRLWLVWNDGRWRRDTSGEAERAAKDVSRSLLAEAARLEGDESRKTAKWALASQSEPRIRAQLALAGSEREVVVEAGDLDDDPWLLACGNGVLDLRTSELREPDPEDLITRGTDVHYVPNARCDRWLSFLDEVFDGDQELIAFLKRTIGYCLTGETREHVLAVFHGSGANGKSTLVGVLRRLLGDFAVTAAFDTFMRQRERGPRNDLARLHRARLVTAAESGEGRRIDEATVKEITGGDVIAARFLYGEFFEFQPQFKLVLVTNHRPKVDGDDDAIWRRIRLVPFEQSFEGREDRELAAKLEAELPGILAWAVRGCLEWQEYGLGQAGAVTRATAEYREDEDVLGAFLAERCAMHGETPTRELREQYEAYCSDLGEKPLGASVLGKRLAKRRVRRASYDGNREKVYQGVSLR